MGSEKLVMPVQRVEGLVITEAGDDVLIYDQNSYSLHTLNKQSYMVWQHCDGIATVDSVSATTGMSADVVKRALTQLEEVSLLEAPLTNSLRSNESRRSLMKKAGIVAIPAIVSVSVPLAKAAASHCIESSYYTECRNVGLFCDGGDDCSESTVLNSACFSSCAAVSGVAVDIHCADNGVCAYTCEFLVCPQH